MLWAIRLWLLFMALALACALAVLHAQVSPWVFLVATVSAAVFWAACATTMLVPRHPTRTPK